MNFKSKRWSQSASSLLSRLCRGHHLGASQPHRALACQRSRVAARRDAIMMLAANQVAEGLLLGATLEVNRRSRFVHELYLYMARNIARCYLIRRLPPEEVYHVGASRRARHPFHCHERDSAKPPLGYLQTCTPWRQPHPQPLVVCNFLSHVCTVLMS